VLLDDRGDEAVRVTLEPGGDYRVEIGVGHRAIVSACRSGDLDILRR
jgi:hypothetical protein